jgi:hypothetical protein
MPPTLKGTRVWIHLLQMERANGPHSEAGPPAIAWILGVLCLGARDGCGIFPFIWVHVYGNGPEKSGEPPSSGKHDVSSLSTT